MEKSMDEKGYIRKALSLSIILILTFTTFSVFPIDSKAESVQLPYPLYDAAAVSTGSDVYVFGGFTPGWILDTIMCYNITKSQLTTLTVKMPAPVRTAMSVWNGKNFYIIGGIDYNETPLKRLVIFTPPDKIQLFEEFFPYGLKGISTIWTGKYIYIFGNCVATAKCGQKNFIRLDPSAMNVTVMDNYLLNGTSGSSVALAGRYAYILGGLTKSGPTDSIYRFDTTTENLTQMKSKLPSPRFGAGAVFENGRIYICGGKLNDITRTDEILVYEPEKDTISVSDAKLPYALSSRAYAKIGENKILICGGQKEKNKIMESFEIISLKSEKRPIDMIILPVMVLSIAIIVIILLEKKLRKGKEKNRIKKKSEK
jgi:uncharacterized protein (UPF0333 family)